MRWVTSASAHAARWCRTPAGVLLLSVLLTVAFAWGANLLLDSEYAGAGTLHTVTGEPALFLLGASVVWLLVLMAVSLTGRLWLGLGVVSVMVGLLAFANHQKHRLVLEPIFPADLAFLTNPGFLIEMVGARVVAAALAACLALLAVTWWAGRRLGRWFPRPGRSRGPWALAGARVLGVLVSGSLLFQLANFHEPGNVFESAYDASGARWRPLTQHLNYADNGFVAGMLYNLPMPAMARPTDYGAEQMRLIAERYEAAADRVNRHRDPDALEDVNVVLVLSEAFSDPTRVDGVRLAEDPIPFTRSLMRRTTSGTMWAPEYGRGTANTEFEALTGMSIASFRPQVSTPFQMVVPNQRTFPSAARFLGDQGHHTLALHSFTSELYRRSEAYPVLGFDEAVFRDEMAHTDTLGRNPFISDAATFDELTDRLDASEAPLFANLVTMQNHYPMAGKYDDPVRATGLADESARDQLEHYARGLRHSDQALRELVTELESSREKTVVAFYGDHLPILWPPGRLAERTQHETPFFVYANFGRQRAQRLPTTSPIHFMNHVLERADARISPYHALLRQLERQIPAMGRGVMIGHDDRMLSPDDLTRRQQRLLHDYRLVQYDLTVGQRHVADEMFGLGPGSNEPTTQLVVTR